MCRSKIKEYFGNYELEELCGRFNIEIDHLGVNPNHEKLVTGLMADTSRENHRRFLEDILSKLLRRCEDRILNTTWEVNVFDEHMLPQLKKLQRIIIVFSWSKPRCDCSSARASRT